MESPIRGAVPHATRLIETFGYAPGTGVAACDLHLARMARGAAVLGFGFDRAVALALVATISGGPQRCRLTLGAEGFDLTTAALPPTPDVWRVRIAAARLDPDDAWLRIKSTERKLYDQCRADLPAGVDEWLFLNTRDQVCEGTITNLFVQTRDGQLLTPALSCGLLPGVLRHQLLGQGWREAVLTLADIASAQKLFMGNALRGLIPVQVDLGASDRV